MAIINVEFKASAKDIDQLEQKLLNLHPVFIGEDNQADTYFNVPQGRLKLREGNIENALIYYERENTSSAKKSDVLLYAHHSDKALKEILTKVYGIKIVVDKKRRIYFMENVKFHFDRVAGLGSFIEVEAIDSSGTRSLQQLEEECNYYASFFGIEKADYIAVSYSDMVVNKEG